MSRLWGRSNFTESYTIENSGDYFDKSVITLLRDEPYKVCDA